MRARGALLVLCVLAALAPVARAAAPASLFIEDLTWTELRDSIAAGKTTVIIPIGGTEQNGPHMAIGKHNVRVRLLAGKIAAALGNALVAPVLPYVPEGRLDPPTGHMRFPGTITVPRDAFDKVIEFAARSCKEHGFRDIVYLGDHGSYQNDEAAAAQRLDREWASSPVRVHAILEYYEESEHGFARLLESRGYPASEVGSHAGLADTSLMMALDPGLVRADRLKPGEGDNGDPTRASAALGQLGVDLIVAKTVAAIRTALERR
ncbi:MAG TPA: creatininase family protein [Stellaceae bacterium]|nr:creatininase family protein [Stellaceae bacterium]